MRILLSNDDGYGAPGLQALVCALQGLAEITVVAPLVNQSGSSHSLSLRKPLEVVQQGERQFSVAGTPADCVHLALTGLMPELPDIVISGINDAPNLADDVYYSGTVAAATEGRFMGLPAMAFSMATANPKSYETAAFYARLLTEKMIQKALPNDSVLNVNVPDVELSDIQGIKATRLGSRYLPQLGYQQLDPFGKKLYWIGPVGAENDNADDTDFAAVNAGFVSVTPLAINVTHSGRVETVSDWLNHIK